jgi:hypothetical protein
MKTNKIKYLQHIKCTVIIEFEKLYNNEYQAKMNLGSNVVDFNINGVQIYRHICV